MKSEADEHFPVPSESIHVSSQHEAENSKHGAKDNGKLGQYRILAPGPSANRILRAAANGSAHTGLFRFLSYNHHNQKQRNHKGYANQKVLHCESSSAPASLRADTVLSSKRNDIKHYFILINRNGQLDFKEIAAKSREGFSRLTGLSPRRFLGLTALWAEGLGIAIGATAWQGSKGSEGSKGSKGGGIALRAISMKSALRAFLPAEHCHPER
jgi:hypothetical protein